MVSQGDLRGECDVYVCESRPRLCRNPLNIAHGKNRVGKIRDGSRLDLDTLYTCKCTLETEDVYENARSCAGLSRTVQSESVGFVQYSYDTLVGHLIVVVSKPVKSPTVTVSIHNTHTYRYI